MEKVGISNAVLRRFFLLFWCFAVSIAGVRAQDQPATPHVYKLEVSGKIIDKLTEKPIEGVTVQILKNGSVLHNVTTSSNGRYKLPKVELGPTYTVKYSKPGMVAQFIEVNTAGIPQTEEAAGDRPLTIDPKMFSPIPDEDFSFMNTEPVAKVSYNKNQNSLEFDLNQINSMKKKIEKVLQKAEQAKADEEKKAQEAELKYQAAMKAGADASKKEDFAGAIAKYNEALTYKKDDSDAKTKLKETEAKKLEWEKKNMSEKEYKNQYDIAEAKFKQKDYDGAIEAYRKAKEYKNDPSLDKKIKDAETAKANDAKAMKEKEYTDLVAAGDKAYKEKDYGNAVANYKKAYASKPDPAIQKKITDIESLVKQQMENETKYSQLLADANKAMLNSKWDDAIKNYQGALAVRADSKEAQEGLAKANAEKTKAGQEAAAEAKKLAEFNAAMKIANDALVAKKYDDAIAGYDKALAIKDDATAKTKKEEAIAARKKADEDAAALKEKEKLEAEYKQAIADGDKFSASKDYDNAIASYEKALKAKSGDKIATDKITATKKLQGDIAEAQRKEKEYNDLKADADADFNAGKYEDAIAKYTKAKTYKPEKYLDDQIAKATTAIATAKANAAKKQEFEANIAQGDKDLAAKEYDKSIAAYQKALVMGYDNNLATTKIEAAKQQKLDFLNAEKNKAEQAKIEAEFLALVKKGDEQAAIKNWTGAIVQYEAALVKKDDAGVKSKIDNARKQKEAEEAALNSEKERTAKYNERIAAGDAAMKANDAATAVSEYQAALDIKNGDKIATDKLAAAKKIIQDAAAKEKEYNAFMAKGNAELDKEKFDESIATYTLALGIKPADPAALAKIEEAKQKKIDWQNKKNQAEAMAANKKKYDEALAKGDTERNAGKFKEAISFYNQALTLVPGDAVAQARIDDANSKMSAREKELADQYAKILAQADADFSKENYADAKGYYERYLKFDKNNSHATQRIIECDTKIKEKAALEAANAKKKGEFDALVLKGDAEVKLKKYEAGIAFYNQALALIADEPTAVKKRNDAQNMLDGAHNAEINKKYNDALNKGDVERNAGKFKEAIVFYNQALEVKPGDAVAQARIDDANSKMSAREKELADQFAKIMAQADKDFDANNYADAKGYYERYLTFDKTNAHATERIKECDAKIKEKMQNDAAYAKKRTEFDALILLGDKELKEKKYDLAIATYTKAIGVLPDEPSAVKKRDEAQRQKDELVNTEVNKKYNEALAKGDNEANTGKFKEAIVFFNQALEIKPGDAVAQARIDAANAKMQNREKELEEQFSKILAQADKDFNAGNYADAITYYERYLTFNKEHAYSKSQITEAKKLMSANAEMVIKRKKYMEFINAGDKLVTERRYNDAIAQYRNAIPVLPDDPMANEKITAAEKLREEALNAAKNKAAEAERLAKYKAAFDAGMVASDAANFKVAIDKFEEALTWKENDKPASDMLAKVRQRQKDKEAEMDAMYQQIITQADKDFDASNYKEALDYYKRASKFKPSEQYPIDRIALCEEKLALANRKHVELKHDGEIVSNQTIDDAMKLIEEAKRQEKFNEEQEFVKMHDQRTSLDSSYAARNKDNRFENKAELDKQMSDIEKLKDNGKYDEKAAEYVAINDANQTNIDNLQSRNEQNIYENKKQFQQQEQQQQSTFAGLDIYRKYKVDSTAEFIDTRENTIRQHSKDQTYSGYQQQKEFEAGTEQREQLFKDMDKNYRGYNVDSLKAVKDNREDSYRTAMHADNTKGLDAQKKFEQDEDTRSELYRNMDKQYRQYKVDSIADFQDQRDNAIRQQSKDQTYAGYQQQKEFEAGTEQREKLFKDMDKNYRGYNVDSLKDLKDTREAAYRENSHSDSKKIYDQQKQFDAQLEARENRNKEMDDQYRRYNVDSLHAVVDNRNDLYRETSKGHSDYVYKQQEVFNKEADAREQNMKMMDGSRQENVKETKTIIDNYSDTHQANKEKQNEIVDEKHDQFKKELDERSQKQREGESKYMENSKEFIKKSEENNEATKDFATTGETKRNANNEKFKNTAPVEPKEYNTGYFHELAQELTEGIHQWTYNKLDEKGKVSEVIIRRIVVKGNTANDYKMMITKWGQHYTKNGQTSNEYTWSVETGGTVIEHSTKE